MKRSLLLMLALAVCAGSAGAAALGTAARSVIPSEIQQIISVDYRRVSNSPVAAQLRDRVLPDSLKQFETALKAISIDPERDIDQLTFASFRDNGQLRFVGVAQGQFPLKKVFARLKARRITPSRYHKALLYSMENGLQMTLLDDNTMLFGDLYALKAALQARDGNIQTLNANSQVLGMMPAVEAGAVWSVLDAIGTQTMMHSSLGEAAKLADYDTLKRRLTGSRYIMDFASGVTFDLDVFTSDSFTAGALSSLIKAGVMFKKTQATGPEKMALDSMSVDSESEKLRLHFKTDDNKFETLLHSDLFESISR